jgi:hypothetical protein
VAARFGFIPPRLSRSRSSLPALNGFVFSVTNTNSPLRELCPMWALREEQRRLAELVE